MTDQIKIRPRALPNFGVIEVQLDDDTVTDLWKLVDEAKEANIDYKHQLAGNIESSLKLDIRSDNSRRLLNLLPQLCDLYIKTYGKLPIILHTVREHDVNLVLEKLWVNFQRKHEFNPSHNHSGALSFAIWMKIPTSFKEQKNLPISKGTLSEGLISNFSFVYTDILGNIRTEAYNMEKQAEGWMVLFPSQLQHQVLPFYNCDEERISISGNIGLGPTSATIPV